MGIPTTRSEHIIIQRDAYNVYLCTAIIIIYNNYYRYYYYDHCIGTPVHLAIHPLAAEMRIVSLCKCPPARTIIFQKARQKGVVVAST